MHVSFQVGGFEKSRDLTDVNDYITKGGRVQVRWTAPEAMYYRQYSTSSDVWSYGCLLYEIWSLGRMPFRDDTNAEVCKGVLEVY
jgi:serine/threonine protein kinase